jgi:predicted AlkP superfamily pyrophosphatase or phosphodiesterase
MRLTAAALLALALACFWLVGAFDRDRPGPPRPAPEAAGERTVVLVSIDGFRADYLDRDDARTPTLNGIAPPETAGDPAAASRVLRARPLASR